MKEFLQDESLAHHLENFILFSKNLMKPNCFGEVLPVLATQYGNVKAIKILQKAGVTFRETDWRQ
jgi:hypothetical protein